MNVLKESEDWRDEDLDLSGDPVRSTDCREIREELEITKDECHHHHHPHLYPEFHLFCTIWTESLLPDSSLLDLLDLTALVATEGLLSFGDPLMMALRPDREDFFLFCSSSSDDEEEEEDESEFFFPSIFFNIVAALDVDLY